MSRRSIQMQHAPMQAMGTGPPRPSTFSVDLQTIINGVDPRHFPQVELFAFSFQSENLE